MRFTEPQMRPPQEARSLLVRATQGCTWNRCRFCYVSRGYTMAAVTDEELEEEVLREKNSFPDNTPVYMTGSNPFAMPVRVLEGWVKVLRRHFPRLSRVSMQTCITDIAKKSDEELVHLRDLGITHLYTGTENGDDEVLALMDKGHTSEDIVRELGRLDRAGITYTCFYVLGMGGKGTGRRCGEATARVFNRVHPTRITTTGMTVFPGTPLADMRDRGLFTEAPEREKIEELHAFLSELSVPAFYDGVHYLNPLNYRFSNADASARKAVLEDIEDVLRTCDDEELERMVNRASMRSL